MATTIERLEVVVDATTEGLRREMDRVDARIAQTFEMIDREGQRISGDLVKMGSASLAERALSIGGILLGLESLRRSESPEARVSREAWERIFDIGNAADQLGVSSEFLQRIQHAGRMMGVSEEDLTEALRQIQARLAEALYSRDEEEAAAAAQAFEDLGVDIANAQYDFENFLIQVLSELGKYENDFERISIGADIFGEDVAQRINTMTRQGRSGLDYHFENADQDGIILEDAFVDAVQELIRDGIGQVVEEGANTIRRDLTMPSLLETMMPLWRVFIQTPQERIEDIQGREITWLEDYIENLQEERDAYSRQIDIAREEFNNFINSQSIDSLSPDDQSTLDLRIREFWDYVENYEDALSEVNDRLGIARRRLDELRLPPLRPVPEFVPDGSPPVPIPLDPIRELFPDNTTTNAHPPTTNNGGYGLCPTEIEVCNEAVEELQNSYHELTDALWEKMSADEAVTEALFGHLEAQQALNFALLESEERLAIVDENTRQVEWSTRQWGGALEAVRSASEQAFTDIVTRSAEARDALQSVAESLLKLQGQGGSSSPLGFLGNLFGGGGDGGILGSLFGGGKGNGGFLDGLFGGGKGSGGFLANLFGGGKGGGGFLSSLFGSGSGGFKALGGPVAANMPYLVGERGPELFVPQAAGRVVPNSQLTTGSNGPTIYADLRGADVAAVQRLEGMVSQLNGSLETRAVAAVQNARQRGGSFAGAFRT